MERVRYKLEVPHGRWFGELAQGHVAALHIYRRRRRRQVRTQGLCVLRHGEIRAVQRAPAG